MKRIAQQTDDLKEEVDGLISDLIDGSAPASPTKEETPQPIESKQVYQLPVRHGKGGKPIDANNKPWNIGAYSATPFLRSVDKKVRPHYGVDLASRRGAPIYPIAPGKVTETKEYPRAGKSIKIVHENGAVGSFYAHLDRVRVSVGDEVDFETVIADMGDTGNAKGAPHLHYEVKVNNQRVNPAHVTGKIVGSLSKKAQLISGVIGMLNKVSHTAPDRFAELRKIAVDLNVDFTLTDKEKDIFDLLRKVVMDKAPGTVLRVAGGWVRDKILGKKSDDIDIALDSMTGVEFGNIVSEWMAERGMHAQVTALDPDPSASKPVETAMIPILGMSIDLVQLRTDEYGEGSRKAKVTATDDPEEDAKRRDLTINALFYNINDERVEDYVGGMDDLRNGVARTPRDPYDTYMEDPLRILRAIRFAGRYNMELDPGLVEAARHPNVQERFRETITPERIWKELAGGKKPEGGWKRGFMVGPNFDRAAEMMETLGLRDMILVPSEEQIERALSKQRKQIKERGEKEHKWERGFGKWDMMQDNPYHNLDVWRHTLKALNYLNMMHEKSLTEGEERSVEDQVVRNIALLFHDIGKCDECSQQVHPEKQHKTYHEHELSSAIIAHEILTDLKAPNDIRDRVVSLIKNHMRLHQLPEESRGAGLRRVVRDVGADNWPLLVEMSKSDSMGKKETELHPKYEAFAQKINEFLEQTGGESEVRPPLNGHEIMQILGLKKGGPAIGRAVSALKEKMLENPAMTKEEATAIVQSMA
jgi:tRNA nucleotidyltransferase/poly(A) polymerase